MDSSLQRIHFIAVGGAIMHNLALALQKKGLDVSGSDDEIYEPAKSRLQTARILPDAFGWFPEKITPELDAVILGMHAREDNPELKKAQELNIPIYSFPEFVFEQTKDKQRIVIAGSHGKTTITSMILHVLKYHNRSFDYLVGAQIEGFDLMVQLTEDAPTIIMEGDEYLASALQRRSKFLFYDPHIVLISGVEWDHFNVFPTYDAYVKSFEELADGLPKAGSLIYDETDDIERIIAAKQREDVTTIPYNAHPHVIENGKAFLLWNSQQVPLRVFGNHNMKNLSGAKEVLAKIGITDEMFYEAIQSFTGASKRLETLDQNKNTLVLRDFAHAPSKVKATVEATQSLYPNRKLIACYELHTFSSLNKAFLPQYAETMNGADIAVIFYSPHTLAMKKMEAITETEIKAAFANEELQIFTERPALEAFLTDQNWYQTNLLLMSSGTFGGMKFDEFGKQITALPVQQVETESTPPAKEKKRWKLFKRK